MQAAREGKDFVFPSCVCCLFVQLIFLNHTWKLLFAASSELSILQRIISVVKLIFLVCLALVTLFLVFWPSD